MTIHTLPAGSYTITSKPRPGLVASANAGIVRGDRSKQWGLGPAYVAIASMDRGASSGGGGGGPSTRPASGLVYPRGLG
jgi:hypothetical protein